MKTSTAITTTLTCLLATTALAVAAPSRQSGLKAESLARALKLAGVSASPAGTAYTFKTSSVSCSVQAGAGADKLGEFSCTVDRAALGAAASFVLEQALGDAGITAIPAGAGAPPGKVRYQVANLTCTIDVGAATSTCTFAAAT